MLPLKPHCCLCPVTLKTWGSGWPEAGRGVGDCRRQQDTKGICAYTDPREIHLCGRNTTEVLNLRIHKPWVIKFFWSHSAPEGMMLSEPLKTDGKEEWFQTGICSGLCYRVGTICDLVSPLPPQQDHLPPQLPNILDSPCHIMSHR